MGETDDLLELTQGEYNMLVIDLEDARAELAAARADLATVRDDAERYKEALEYIAQNDPTFIFGGKARAALDHGAGERRAAAVPGWRDWYLALAEEARRRVGLALRVHARTPRDCEGDAPSGAGEDVTDEERRTVTCRSCAGAGRIEVGRCAAIVKDRQCSHVRRSDPGYFEKYPDRAWMRDYCALHGNIMLKGRRRQHAKGPTA